MFKFISQYCCNWVIRFSGLLIDIAEAIDTWRFMEWYLKLIALRVLVSVSDSDKGVLPWAPTFRKPLLWLSFGHASFVQ